VIQAVSSVLWCECGTPCFSESRGLDPSGNDCPKPPDDAGDAVETRAAKTLAGGAVRLRLTSSGSRLRYRPVQRVDNAAEKSKVWARTTGGQC
jgi:hypothetical protein